MNFRYLKPEEIEVRVSQIYDENSCSFLLYKNARCDMNILDETVGPFGWQREHFECKGNLFCRVGIKDEKTGEWVWKSDCGKESQTEAEKGESSDSFKRACFNWGIGRELYTAPFIYVKNSNTEYVEFGKNQKGKLVLKSKIYVNSIEVKDGKITYILLKNAKNNQTVFVYGKPEKEARKDYTNDNEKYCKVLAEKKGLTEGYIMHEAVKAAGSDDGEAVCKVLCAWMRNAK